jgi:hypothetical protein
MKNASVIIDINATNLMNNITLSFSGNYTIFNPSEEMNVTIAAPFSKMDIGPNSTCNIKLNGSLIPHNAINFESSDSNQWDDYFSNGYYEMMLLICNITIPENESVILEYTFDAKLTVNLNDLHKLWIYYIVGTARTWAGKITESVEFNIYGKTPDEFYEHRCSVSELLNGTSYLWEWENEIIYDDEVYITYYGNYNYSGVIIISESLIQQIIIGSIIIIAILGFAYMMMRRLRSTKLWR